MLIKTGAENQKVNNIKNTKLNFISFSQRQRNERNILLELTSNSGSISDIRSRQIKTILEDIAKNGDDEDISLLLSVTKNLKYGYFENSPLGNFLNTKSNIAQMDQKQNNNWANLLENTLRTSLEKSTSPKKADFIKQLNQIFSKTENENFLITNKEISSNPVFQQQAQAIKYRNKILNSYAFNTPPKGLSPKESEDFEIDRQRTKRNIDYFLASSECTLSEKIEVLNKLSIMMSREYSINKQLKDKKVKVLSEILNDIVIRTPENIRPNIKDVDQVRHGICAAISYARKAVAYEDKVAYINSIYMELDDNPQMYVFDITKLGKKIKIPIAKTYIDYNSLIKKGYRIIDSSVFQWMNVAGTTGSGSNSVEYYIGYDSQNYEMFNDSKMYPDLEGEDGTIQNYLRTLSKTRKDLQSITESKILDNIGAKEAYKNFNKNIEVISSIYQKAFDILKQEFPSKSSEELRKISKSVMKIQEAEDENFRIHPKEAEVLKKQKIITLVKSFVGNIDKEKGNRLGEELYQLYDLYSQYSAQLPSSKGLNKKAKEYKRLFKIAADIRICTEKSCLVKENNDSFCAEFNLPSDVQLISKRLEDLIKDLEENNNTDKVAKILGKEPNKDSLLKYLKKMQKEFEVNIPNKIDMILKALGIGTRQHFLNSLLTADLANFLNNPTNDLIDYYASILKVKPEKEIIEKTLKQVSQELQNPISEKRIVEIGNIFGIGNYLSIADGLIDQFMAQELSESTVKNLSIAFDIENSQVEVFEKLSEVKGLIEQLYYSQIEISQKIKAPNSVQMILKKLEKRGDILSRETLDKLKAKFDSIEQYEINAEKALKRGENTPPDKNIYKFNQEEEAILKRIESMLPSMTKVVEKEYKKYNKIISNDLNTLYDYIGRQKGRFWLSEEGHSGLFSGEQVRIAEQMTDRPYYINENLLSSIKQIKETGKSGVMGTNVDYDTFSGHAQYIGDIKTMPIADSKTGEISQKEVLFQDNSWGAGEKVRFQSKNTPFWKDLAGYERTNYASADLCGGPKGFILDSTTWQTGLEVNDLLSDYGINKPYVPENKKLKKLIDFQNETFPIFNDIVLEGDSPKLYTEFLKLIDSVFEIGTDEKKLNELINILQKNKNVKINTDKLEKIEDSAEQIEQKWFSFIKGSNQLPQAAYSKEIISKMSLEEKIKLFGIDSKETFDNLPQNHKLKLLLRKIGLYDLLLGETFEDKISTAKTHQELDEVEDKILENIKKLIKESLKEIKTPREEIKKIKDITENFEYSYVLINWIDKKFNPKTDEELIDKLFELQTKPNLMKQALEESTRVELGMKIADPYDLIKQIRAENYRAESKLNKAIFSDLIGTQYDLYNNTKSPQQKSEQLYRSLFIAMSYLDKKTIKKYKEMFFNKYQVRPAFPEIPVIDKEEVNKVNKEWEDFFIETVQTISDMKKFAKLEELYQQAQAGADIIRNNYNKESVIALYPILNEMKNVFADEDEEIKNILDNIIKSNPKDFIANFAELKKTMEEIQKQLPQKDMKKLIGNSIKNTNTSCEIMIKSYIQPKHQSQMKEVINNLIRSLYKNENRNAPENQHALNLFRQNLEKCSVLNNPIDILHNILNILENPSQNKSVNLSVMTNLKNYANRAFRASDLTEIEYKIMKNIQNGNITRFKRLMGRDYLVGQDKTKFKMDSKDGLGTILLNLLDEKNQNRTLKLFVESLGLNEEIVSFFNQVIKPEEQLKSLLDTIQEAKNAINDRNLIKEVLTKGLNAKDMSNIPSQVFEQIKEKLTKNNVGEEKTISKFLQIYCRVMEENLAANKQPFSRNEVINVVNKAHIKAFNKAYANFQENLEDINTNFTDLQSIEEIITTLSLNEDSETYKQAQNYQQELIKVIQKIAKEIEKLNSMTPAEEEEE